MWGWGEWHKDTRVSLRKISIKADEITHVFQISSKILDFSVQSVFQFFKIASFGLRRLQRFLKLLNLDNILLPVKQSNII